jgi:hypothetical protein
MKFTPEEREAVIRESRRILQERDNPHPRPLPEALRPEVPLPPFEDDVARWKREADESEARRERERDLLQRQSRAAQRAQTADRATIDVLTAEVAALRRDLDAKTEASNELARGLIEFGQTVETKLVALEASASRLERILDALKTTYKQGFSALTARVAGAEAAHAREAAFTGRQLEAARREISVLKAARERKADRELIAKAGEATVIELQALRRDLSERGGAA